jgi:hypothetical protein
VAVLVTWMSFTSDARELRRGALSMLETHIMMSSLIFRLIFILVLRLILTLVLHITLLLVLCLSSLMDLTITHMVLVHKRTALCLDALVTAHILIVVIVPRVGPVFAAEGFHTRFEPRHLDGPRFLHRGSRLTHSNGDVQNIVKTSSGHMVKCCISKIYLTNFSTEPSIFSHPM